MAKAKCKSSLAVTARMAQKSALAVIEGRKVVDALPHGGLINSSKPTNRPFLRNTGLVFPCQGRFGIDDLERERLSILLREKSKR